MRRIFILSFSVFYFGAVNYSYASGWQILHERADKTSLSQALSEVNLNPGSIDNLYILGLVYLNHYKDKEAVEVFERIIAREPEFLGARWGIAEALRRKHKIEESEEMLNAIIKAKEDFSPAYITLAYVKYRQMDFKETAQLALGVIRQGRESVDLSNYTRAYLLLGGAKGMLASQGGALAKVIHGTAVLPNLKRAEALQPDSVAVLFGLGSFYFLAPAIAGGNINRAQDYLERAVETDPLFADAYVRLAQVYKVQGNSEKYEEYLDKARQIDPQNVLLRDFETGQCKFNCVTVKR